MKSLLGISLVCLIPLVATTGILAPLDPATPTGATPPPLPPSPVAVFRQMLDTNEVGRAQALARRPASQRQLLEAKLREYDALSQEAREQRLRATEFLWYLRPLLASTPTNRTGQLQSIPAGYRELIRERVARWDALPDTTRHDLLAYDHALDWLSRNRLLKAPALPPPPPGLVSRQLEQELSQWQALPRAQRDALCDQFEDFFELAPAQRQRALQELLDEEQKLMQETLEAFNRLPRAQRALCIVSFRKFATLSPAERADFLRSANRWREMSPAERNQWRQLVTALPPLPPGFDSPPPLPPPPRLQTARTSSQPPGIPLLP